jgi:hypothetical protein
MAQASGEPRAGPGSALRVGVIGLGRRWRQHYQPALAALRGSFRLTAVCDHVAERARLEAQRLGCDAAAGPTELIERADVDALLLLDRQWYGLWPLEAACRLSKPAFCGNALARDNPHADRLRQRIEASALPVMVALPAPPPAALALVREVLAVQLGTPQQLVGYAIRPKAAEAADLFPCPAALLGWCAALLDGEPRRLLATRSEGGALAALLLDYGDGRVAHLCRARSGHRSWHLRVVAERGSAVVAPGVVCWSGPGGHVTHRLARGRPAGQVGLDAFYQAVTTGTAPRPGLAEAYRLLCWRRLAGRSSAEGRWVCADA